MITTTTAPRVHIKSIYNPLVHSVHVHHVLVQVRGVQNVHVCVNYILNVSKNYFNSSCTAGKNPNDRNETLKLLILQISTCVHALLNIG